MSNGSDALFGATAAARTKRIGSDIHVRARSVSMGEPAEVTRREHLFKPDDSLCGTLSIVSAQEKGDGFPRSEATGKKVSSGLAHQNFPRRRRRHCGLA